MTWSTLLSAQRLGHTGAEMVTAARNPFQKDWDRVVFSSAFRRLQDKTQVHSLPESDYVRNRLTHSMEVASVGRSLGASVGEQVIARHFAAKGRVADGIGAPEFGHIVAAACIAHDIGNPPFGHFGENVVRNWFIHGEGRDLIAPLAPAEQADFMRFEGNAQGFRILTRLQNWRDAGGLRLTCATLAAFAKYPRGSQAHSSAPVSKFGFFSAERDLFADVAKATGLRQLSHESWVRHPLAHLLEAADDICYRVVDLEDGYKLGRIDFATVEELMHKLVHRNPPRYREIDDPAWRIAYLRAKAIGQLVDDVVAAFLDHEAKILAGTFAGDLVMETRAAPTIRTIEQLTRERIFETRERFATEVAGAQILETLLAAFCRAFLEFETKGGWHHLSPRALALLRLFPDPPAEEKPPTRYEWLLGVTDFISGMTDGYALRTFRRLSGLARD